MRLPKFTQFVVVLSLIMFVPPIVIRTAKRAVFITLFKRFLLYKLKRDWYINVIQIINGNK